MIRRLFLSLLILSALTSDGSLNIAEYIINPQLYENAGLNNLIDCEVLTGKSRVLATCNGVGSTDVISCTNYSKCVFLPEVNRNGIHSAVIDDYNYCLNLYVFYSQGFKSKDIAPLISKDITLYMSDLSPPCEKLSC